MMLFTLFVNDESTHPPVEIILPESEYYIVSAWDDFSEENPPSLNEFKASILKA